MRLFKVLCVASLLLLAGCGGGEKWSTADIQEKLKASYNQELIAKGEKDRCTEVHLVREGDDKLTGFANFTDGSQKSVKVTIDPSGKWIAE